MGKPRNHHYLPQFYVRPWCGPDKLVASYHWSPAGLRCSRISPKSIGSERDLYSKQNPSAPDPQWAETEFYSKFIDGPAAMVRDKLLAGNTNNLSLEERQSWARFIASLIPRMPEALNPMRSSALQRFVDMVMENPPASRPDLTRDEVMRIAQEKSPGAGEDFTLTISLTFVESDSLYKPLLQLQWSCLDTSDSGVDLMTCDFPMTFAPTDGPDMELFLIPISPTMLFFATNVHEAAVRRSYARDKAGFVDLQNRNNMAKSRRFVIARECGRADFVQQHFPRPTRQDA